MKISLTKVIAILITITILKRIVGAMCFGRRGGLVVTALVPGASGPGSSLGWVHCVVFLGKTLSSHSASLHPGV